MTAVDILYKFLYKMESFEGFDPYVFNQEEVFAKAKAIEKEQIIDARQDGYESTYNSCESGCMGRQTLDGSNEQYYNETFKSE